ncbi:MAG: RHS repeat-associated core domain-containing protein, partial [Bacteroidota bacterium]
MEFNKNNTSISLNESLLNCIDLHRFGFNGQEKDDEITGVTGSHLDFGARVYDSRIGRWLACDPLAIKYPNLSPYQYTANNPIAFIDPNGKEIKWSVSYDENNKPVINVTVTGKVVD